MKNEKVAIKVSITSIIGNVILSILKLIASILGKSQAMFSDAIHSLSDVLSTLVVIIGVKISSKEDDEDHPYGHEKLESIASIILSFMLFVTALGIGYAGLNSLLKPSELQVPKMIALVAAIVSIIIKEIMFQYTNHYGKKIKSDALMADAWHHRSDALSSIGSLLGIGFAMLGYPVFDAIASIIICLLIIKVSLDIFRSATDKIVDKSCDEETFDEIRSIILSNENVLGIDSIKTRQFGNKIYVDVEISLDKNLSFVKAHDISEKIHDKLEKKMPMIKHCMVHANPSGK
ncbi:MAG: cation transporter [Bacilli bacterium]|nr:cation transporter [Bacilli bacterium]